MWNHIIDVYMSKYERTLIPHIDVNFSNGSSHWARPITHTLQTRYVSNTYIHKTEIGPRGMDYCIQIVSRDNALYYDVIRAQKALVLSSTL